MKRKFKIEVTVTATVEVDDKVFEATLTPEWRGQFYPFHKPEDVVGHIAFNMIRGLELSQLDGFANLSNDLAGISGTDWDDWQVKEVRR